MIDIFRTKLIWPFYKNATSIKILLKFIPKGLNDQVCVDLGKGLASNKRRAATWTNDDTYLWRI